MLTIFDRNLHIESNLPIEKDVEKLFATIHLKGTQEERKIIEVIEQGKWCDDLSFIDRFGFRLPLDELSTGTKAALSVLNRPDIILDTICCGVNAVDAMVCFCKNGNIIMDLDKVSFEDSMIEQIENGVDICINGLRIYDIDAFTTYVNDAYWLEPSEIEERPGIIERLK